MTQLQEQPIQTSTEPSTGPDATLQLSTTIRATPIPEIGPKRRPIGIWAARAAIAIGLIVLVGYCGVWGLRLRIWAWEQTAAVHFYPDVANGIDLGSEALRPKDTPRGFLNVYDVVAATSPTRADKEPEYHLDYSPLRLWLMTRWVEWARTLPNDQFNKFKDSLQGGAAWGKHEAAYDLFTYTLRFNDGMTIVAAVGLFLLTRHWVIRGDKRIGSASRAGRLGAVLRPFRGCFAGLTAMLLFWFNPAVILSTHGWPTWDEWVIPFFVWGIYLACTEWWFVAGLTIAVGAMFKGQQLFVAPLFLLWPLMLGKWQPAYRWVSGLVFGVAAIASPWLLTYLPNGATSTTSVNDRRVLWPGVACTTAVFVCLIVLPVAWIAWQRRRGALLPLNLLRDRWYFFGMPLVLGVTLLACGQWLGGSMNWMKVGWGYGMYHYPRMVQGVSDNLAGLLDGRFGWHNLRDPVMTLPLSFDIIGRLDNIDAQVPATLFPVLITIRILLVIIYVVTFLACVIAMAIQAKRNDPNFLIAMTGVWLMFFAWMPQIHERYLLYAAGVGCSLVACGVGMSLLNLFLTALTFVMTLHVMLDSAFGSARLVHFATGISPTFAFSMRNFCKGTFPDAGWAVLLAAGVFLVMAFQKSAVRRRF